MSESKRPLEAEATKGHSSKKVRLLVSNFPLLCSLLNRTQGTQFINTCILLQIHHHYQYLRPIRGAEGVSARRPSRRPFPVRTAVTFLEEQNQNHDHASHTSPTPPHAATAAATVGQASSAHKASQTSNSTLPRPVLGPKRFLCTQCDIWFNVSKNHDSARYSHSITGKSYL